MFTIDSKGPVTIRIYSQQNSLAKDFALAVPSGSMVEIHFYEGTTDSKSVLNCEIDVENDLEINPLDAPLKAPRENDLDSKKMIHSKKYARIKKQLDDELDAYHTQCSK